MKKICLYLITCIFILGGFSTADAITDIVHWDGLNIDVEITYPDKVVYGDYFDISFFIDSTPLASGSMLAFIPNIQVGNTVDISSVTWSEDYESPTDPDFHGDYMGNLGDTYSPYAADSGGYNITLLDPYWYYPPDFNGYTWLESSYQDKVTWTLHNFIIQGDTDFNITLNADYWSDGNFQSGTFTVFDPPAGIAVRSVVPEPASSVLFIIGGAALTVGQFFKRKFGK